MTGGPRRAAVAALGLALAGCALTPDYERPPVPVPDAWREPADAGVSFANLPWWQLFEDPVLVSLIERALVENKDRLAALARIQRSRELVIVNRANQLPFVDLFGAAGRGRQSQISVPGAGTRDTYAASADLFFEIDLWRKLSRATEAARADLLATESAYRSVTITLIADVATTYLLLLDLDARLAISRRTEEGRRGSLDIIRARFEKGVVAELDVNQAEIELAIAEAAVAVFERQVAQAEHALRVLLGRVPGPVERGAPLAALEAAPEIPVGLPSELLQRRPDVLAAEATLAAETARIGVAEALRYPSFTLTGSFGAVSDELSDLTTHEAKAWNLLGAVFAPLWNSGQLKARADAQRAVAEEALRSYELALIQAFREVEDALVAIRTFRIEHAARQRQVEAARNAARLSRARYDGGVVDYLEVLDTERSLFSSELDASASRQQALGSVVLLYKALGGGWFAPPAPAQP